MPKLSPPVTPILRIFDVEKARDFWIGFLGFEVEFEHRFTETSPVYMGLSRDGCFIHLSEHHGDAIPGSHIRVRCDDARALSAELRAKKYKYSNPGEPQDFEWGERSLTIADPFGNRITFVERTSERPLKTGSSSAPG